jgi:hypothetical protein
MKNGAIEFYSAAFNLSCRFHPSDNPVCTGVCLDGRSPESLSGASTDTFLVGLASDLHLYTVVSR